MQRLRKGRQSNCKYERVPRWLLPANNRWIFLTAEAIGTLCKSIMLWRNVSSSVINITFYISIFFEIDWKSSGIRIWNNIPTRKIRKEPICLKKKCCNPLGKTNLSNLHKHISSGISVRTSAIFFLARKSVKYPIEIKTCSRSREKIIPFRSYGLFPPPSYSPPTFKKSQSRFLHRAKYRSTRK